MGRTKIHTDNKERQSLYKERKKKGKILLEEFFNNTLLSVITETSDLLVIDLLVEGMIDLLKYPIGFKVRVSTVNEGIDIFNQKLAENQMEAVYPEKDLV
jgi:hypothetical protein